MTTALLAGADDFMVKPTWAAPSSRRACRPCCAAPTRPASRENWPTAPITSPRSPRTIRLHGEPVRLKQREYELALFLFHNIGRLLSREHLMQAVWGQELEAGSRSLDTHVSRLRARLDLRPENGMVLAAVYGLGYRLEFLSPTTSAELPCALAGAAE